MIVKVRVEYKWFPIEVLPTDTIWTLKWKIYENESIRRWCCRKRQGSFLAGPDDQKLTIDGRERLECCERSLESYSIHEGSELICDDVLSEKESFQYVINGFRKKKNGEKAGIEFTPLPYMKHGSIHFHEVRSIRLELRGTPISRTMSMLDYMICSMPSLKELDLSHSRSMRNEGCIRIAEGLKSNVSLKKLHLVDCGIGAEGAIKMAQMLEKNSSLATLDLSWNNYIGDKGCVGIAKVLETRTSLKKLRLRDCGIGSDGAISIAQMLAKNYSLLTLDLSKNGRIGDEGCIQIAQRLETNASLKELCIRRCEIESEGAMKIAQMLGKNSSLRILNLSSNSGIQNEGCIRIAKALESNTSLKKLLLCDCGIESEGAIKMGQMLEKNSSLASLGLSRNEGIGNEGLLQIAEALETNTSLKKLYLGDCGIRSQDATTIGQMLGRNSSLTTLHLSGNDEIGDDGIIPITEGLTSNDSLKKLDICRCRISSEGCVRLGQMIEKNSSLEIICLSENFDIGDEGCTQIIQGLETNIALKELDLLDCGIHSEDLCHTIDSLLERNCIANACVKSVQEK